MATEATSDWIEWKGGECPVSADTLVDTKLRSGGKTFGFQADRWIVGKWQHGGDRSRLDIIAYRVVSA
ncbi:MAG: hypothetical protein EON59_03775 [Alphaproteobacteria bacterium]|nr:MAG: hypothetical protein EON59_03775 [Alphaproteobacteria bacterium]